MLGGAPMPLDDEDWAPEAGALGFGSAIFTNLSLEDKSKRW